ncbi:Hsp20/alpha crystallin family protein [Cytophaga sp. FL35]|uniref:Hsp20/alpha crystallin family protein n=1 Tax=Cytophaga sp. FL35 TaxID=1904456 RepID=UPI000C4E537E|nr:Hsp20/alpha crystallin family protein [Cytophaga sp. FL35]MAU70624.1 heat-shock protein [Pseudozobellia sp.]MBC7000740.1 Hsp20/alpha crystallin family protein [Cytophaga sp. FL35]MBG48111.1 heat-shock protein [Pseudozobellia sp.]|tara:strand:+ start:1784 stop:2254 length:471 start_codon:yes stop_codon:yes gene_type:complete
MNNVLTVPKNGSLATSDLGLANWSNWIDNVLKSELSGVLPTGYNNGITLPRVNIKETSDAFILEMAVPGMQKSDFQIELDNLLLSIFSKSEVDEQAGGSTYARREFGYTNFKRTFRLPETVDCSRIGASYQNGILEILLPKKEEARQKPPRIIQLS